MWIKLSTKKIKILWRCLIMKFKIEQKDLYEGIQIVQKAVANKQTMPILTGIYLEAKKDKGLHLIGTDLELGIEHYINADIKEEGSIVIPANSFTQLVRELPKEKINFDVDLDNYQINLSCSNSKFNLKGYDPDEYPQLPEINVPENFTLATEDLKKLIREVEFSTSNDETQPALTGSLFNINENEIIMVSTNTYRLAYSRMETDFNFENKEEIEIILPSKTLNELTRLLDGEEVEIFVDSNYIKFNFQDITIISRLIEGKFPNYRQVMPDKYNTKVFVDKKPLQNAVKRASLIAKMDSNVLNLKIKDNKLIINSANSEQGYAHEEINIDVEGPDQKITIDAGYLLDVLKIIDDDKVTLELIGPLNPFTLKKVDNDNYIYLIMPVRSD